MTLVFSRARAHPAPLVAVVVNVLIVCTLVAGIGATLPLVQQASLAAGLSTVPAGDGVVTAVSPYDDEDPAAQDRIVTGELAPVTDVAGGEVVSRLDSGSYDLLASGRPTWAFTALSGADSRLRFDSGRAPAAGDGALEVAVPAGSEIPVGERLTLVNRSDDRRVVALVVGVWALSPDSERWVGEVDRHVMLVSPERFDDLAGAGSSATWRAVPDFSALRADQLDELSDAVATATTSGVGRAAEQLSASVRADTALVEVLAERARELVVLRALLLVPAALLLLLGAGCLFLVAARLADARREEESLLRSRGAGYGQLVAPTVLESLLLCGVCASVAPLLASLVVRVGDSRPPLTVTAWVAAAFAAIVCVVALTLPAVIRALTGDRGQQLSVERQRRRSLTVLAATVLLVAVLGGLAVLELRGFGETVVGASTSTPTIDPLLVVSPALLLLALAVLVALLLLPVLFRLVASTLGSRGVSFALGSRFAARAPAKAVPLALVVILASGTLSFAAIQRLSGAEARDARADFEVGADVRVVPPADALRAGPDAERQFLESLAGVDSVHPVHRAGTFLEDLPAAEVVTDLSGATAAQVLPPEDVTRWRQLVARPWRDPAIGVPVPDGASRLQLALDADQVQMEQVTFLFADSAGALRPLVTRGQRATASLDLRGALAPDSRLVGVRTGTQGEAVPDQLTPDRSGRVRATVSVDGEVLTTAGRWWTPGQSELVTFGARPELTAALPVALTARLAAGASLQVGDTFELDVLGIPVDLEVVTTVPYLRTVAESDGSGLLLDAGTALPTLVAGGFTEDPDEWWLSVGSGRADPVAATIAGRAEVAETVTTRNDVAERLDEDPSTGGAALGQLLVLTAAGCLVVGGLLLLSVVLLGRRQRAAQDRTLVTVGAHRRDLLGVIVSEYALTTGAGVLTGLAVGAVVAQVTLESMTLGPDGQPLLPAPELHVPWLSVLLPLAAMVVLPLLAMVMLTRWDHARDLVTADRGVR